MICPCAFIFRSVFYLLLGIFIYVSSLALLSQWSRQQAYELKRGRRGAAVHSKVERIEQQVQPEEGKVAMPSLIMLAMINLACAGMKHDSHNAIEEMYANTCSPFSLALFLVPFLGTCQYLSRSSLSLIGFDLTPWSVLASTILHSILGVHLLLAYIQARSLWKAIGAQKVD